ALGIRAETSAGQRGGDPRLAGQSTPGARTPAHSGRDLPTHRGQQERLGLIYLDSCLLIYLEEEDPRFVDLTVTALASRGDFCLSALVKAECMVGAYRRNDPLREASYERLFGRSQTLE